MPKIKSEIGKSRVHIKAATLGGATQQPLDFTKLTKQVSWADEKPVSSPRVKIDKSQINYKNPFGDLLIDSSVLQAQVGVYDKLKAEEATADAEQKKQQQQTVEPTKQLPRPNKKQRRLQKRSDFHKKLQQEKEERRKPKQKKVCLKEFKTMRSALSEVVVSSKPSDDEMPLYSPSMDTFLSTSSGGVTSSSSGGSGKVKKNRKKKNEHLLQQNNIRSVPKFLRKKRVQKSFDDIMCFQQAIKQCTTADEHLLLKNIKK